MTTGGAGRPPFTDPLAGLSGDLDELRASLTADEVLELCRYWNWRWETHEDGWGRWWCSKLLSAAMRELDRRGIDRNSWLD